MNQNQSPLDRIVSLGKLCPAFKIPIPGRTVRADIRLDIRKIKDVHVELSVQPWISVINRAPISVAPISARISAWMPVLRISEREVYCGYPWWYE